jgi:hypothetical protein
MTSAPRHYDRLLSKLDAFIRKYYLNKAIRGALYALGLVLLLFLLVSLLESQFYFAPGTRQLLGYGFLLASLLAVGIWVGVPLCRYFRLGQTLSHEQAAAIIGRHFGNVQDKLLNVLQLRRQAGDERSNALVLASIDQKAAEISPVPFRSAIDLRHNRRYLKYALPPLLVLVFLLVAAPSLIRDSTSRLIRNTETFERPAPFAFVVDAGELEVIQYQNFPLTVRVEGEVSPAEAFIEVEGYRYRLQRRDAGTFTYQFNNVRKDTPFRLTAGPVSSRDYTLDVLPKPSIAGFTVDLDYPDYLGRRDEQLSDVGDLTLPAGTQVQWTFVTDNTEHIDLRFASDDSLRRVAADDRGTYAFDRRALRNDAYTLYIGNERLPLGDSVSYALSVIPDRHPQIVVERFGDSTRQDLVFFAGEASDDYGIRRVDFVYRVRPAGGDGGEEQRSRISGRSGTQHRYEHVIDLAEDFGLAPGDELTYYFEVYDNDAVNGSKSARTQVMNYRRPSREEVAARSEANDSKIKEELTKALQSTRELKEDTKELREKMLQEKDVDWKLKKEIEKLAERQREIQEQIQEAQRAFEENRENNPPREESIQQKEEKLEELFEESVNEELENLMQEIQRLMEELNKEETLESMEEMQLSDEEAEAKLDRMLELFKQLEIEKEMQDAIRALEELAEEQEELAEETESGETSPEELGQKQEELREQLEQLNEQLEQTEQKNEALEQPMPLDEQEQQRQEAEQSMRDAEQQLRENKPQEAAPKQKEASEQMKQAAQEMSEAMQSMQMESNQEDLAAIRQLLENIVDLSFDQEETMDQLGSTTVNTPRYVELVQEQFRINNDFDLVRDSLQALAKRNFQIETFITDKVTEIQGNLDGTVTELEERNTSPAANLQQRAMTGLNDLALMLSESMDQMQQQMASMMQGQQQCQSPQQQGKGKQGQGTPSENKGSEGQKQLGEQMQEIKEGLKPGGEGASSREFAEMAARQAALRKALEEKQRQLQQSGEGKDGELQELIDRMNDAEEDLVNKRLTEETLQRQQEILTRMLDHERAEREQKMDEKRKSETASQQQRALPPALEEYLRERQAQVKRFRRATPQLTPYYRSLVDRYIQSSGAR